MGLCQDLCYVLQYVLHEILPLVLSEVEVQHKGKRITVVVNFLWLDYHTVCINELHMNYLVITVLILISYIGHFLHLNFLTADIEKDPRFFFF